jgi:hypothetical protein
MTGPSRNLYTSQGSNGFLVGRITKTNRRTQGDIMKNLFTPETAARDGSSTIHQSPDRLPNVTKGNLPVCRPGLNWFNASAPSGRNPFRRNDESSLMSSQLR